MKSLKITLKFGSYAFEQTMGVLDLGEMRSSNSVGSAQSKDRPARKLRHWN